MTEASQDRALGRLESKVDLILVDNERAAHSRKEQYEKLEQITRKADSTDRKIDSIDSRLKAVEEPVADFEKWRERAIGALMLVALVSSLIGAITPWIWRKLVALLS
jgi:ABC-type enterochelin transport system substrate-binding protein